jgi:antitoxin ParD1/3/4/toxin ParE1/3/4
MPSVQYTPEAEDDLLCIWEQIASDNVPSAKRVIQRLVSAIDRLAQSPGIGHWRDDLAGREYRFFAVYSYLVVYRAESSPLEIVRIVHAARDVQRLLDPEFPSS